MGRKRPELNFDDLKNTAHSYHYSREERLKHGRDGQCAQEKQQTKWYYRVLGNNRTTFMMLVFYILLAGVFWFFWWAMRTQAADNRVFRVTRERIVQVRWISNEMRQGWNVVIDNKSRESVWHFSVLRGVNEKQTVFFATNVSVGILPGDFLVWFFPFEGKKPPMAQLILEVKE